MTSIIKKLGPGLLFAGAAIGVSHLVQSTRAGADYGLGLIWALLLVNLFKYPFFEFGPRYTGATGESLLDGYKRLGKPVLWLYFILSLGTMFTIQTAVTIVTAGIANALFGDISFFGWDALGLSSIELWTIIILLLCFFILRLGRYRLLDNVIKFVIILLALSTVLAVCNVGWSFQSQIDFSPFWPNEHADILFLIAFMGWMPAPIDVAIFHSLWAEEKIKETKSFNLKSALFDFNVGYAATIVMGLLFVLLGYMVMNSSNQSFGSSAVAFAKQLIQIYTESLGGWSWVIIAIAALTAMFSTTITTLDASPRAMARTISLLFDNTRRFNYSFWLVVLTLGTILIFVFLASEMGVLVEVATVLSFITAPIYAGLNYYLITSKHTPKKHRPGVVLRVLSWLGLIFLVVFSLWFLMV